MIYKLPVDPMLHLIFGLGAGDLHIATSGAERLTLEVRNVLFIHSKTQSIENLVGMKVDTLDDYKSPKG